MKTDIVVTIGPASASNNVMEKMILAGASVFRFPFAREPFDVNLERSYRLREIASRLGKQVFLMQDVPGRKIRIAIEEDIPVKTGQYVAICKNQSFEHIETDIRYIPISNADVLPEEIQSGTTVYFGDGEVEAKVIEYENRETVVCEISNDGTLQRYRGVTFRDHFREEDGLTEIDKSLIKQGLDFGYDFIALSFVQNPQEIRVAKSLIVESTYNVPKFIAKIETRRGVENIEEILNEVDAIMVARGDLAIQVPYEELPVMEWNMLRQSLKKNKYSIVATQMIESVEFRRVPNRSEVIDIATAVYWGASALMCSGETRSGSQPVYSVEVMKRIAQQAERDLDRYPDLAAIKYLQH